MKKNNVAFALTFTVVISLAFTPEVFASCGGPTPAQISDPKNYKLTRIAMNDPRLDSKGNPIDSSLLLDLTFAQNGKVWFTGEFQTGVSNVTPNTNAPAYLTFPDAGKIFSSSVYPGQQTVKSALAEDITADTSGRVWVTQGGGAPDSMLDNHSRVISITSNNATRVYNVPGNNNSVVGIIYDKDTNKIYFLEQALLAGAQPRLVSFTPGSIDTSIGFDNPAGLKNLRCASADNRNNCYFSENVPFGTPARLVMGLDGNIYFTGSYDYYLGKYNPQTRNFTKFVLPYPRNVSGGFPISFPWDIEVDPASNDILLTEYGDQQIVRFQTKKEKDNLCQVEKVSADGSIVYRGNPSLGQCFIEYEAKPNAEATMGTHSLDIDQFGNVWFTTHDYIGVIAKGETQAKYRRIRGQNVLKPEHAIKDHMTGIRVNESTGDIWVTSFYSREVYRLERNF